MNAAALSQPAIRKLAALAILAGLMLAVYGGIVQPMIDDGAAQRDAQSALKSALVRYRAAAAELPALETRLAALQEERQEEAGYIEAANETLAAAAVQSRIKSAVVGAGGRLHSVEVLRSENEGAMLKIAVRTRVAIELPGLQRVLYDLNETSPVLFFESLDIARAEAMGRDTADRSARLDVDFTVFGYLRRPG